MDTSADQLIPLPFEHVRNARDGRMVFQLQVPRKYVGLVIGRGGSNVKEVEATAGVEVHLETCDMKETDRLCACTLIGTKFGVQLARWMIQETVFKQIRPFVVDKSDKHAKEPKRRRGKKARRGIQRQEAELAPSEDRMDISRIKVPRVQPVSQNSLSKPPKKSNIVVPRVSSVSCPCEEEIGKLSYIPSFTKSVELENCTQRRCEYTYSQSRKLDLHIKKIHRDPLKERIRNKYRWKDPIDQPLDSHREFECNKCWKSFSNKKPFMKHLVIDNRECDVKILWSQRRKCFFESKQRKAKLYAYNKPDRRDPKGAVTTPSQNPFSTERIGLSSNTMSVTQKSFILVVGPPLKMAPTSQSYWTTHGMGPQPEFDAELLRISLLNDKASAANPKAPAIKGKKKKGKIRKNAQVRNRK